MRGGGGIRLGRLFGISVEVDWSWLFIFALVTWSLSSAFGGMHPQWTAMLRWTTAVVAALLFFASVLAHELAHSLVARAQGVPVRRITLFLFGGVASIEKEPESPGNEFVMAIVGPVTSMVIGVALTLVASLIIPVDLQITDPMVALGQLGPVTTLLFWLGSVNIMLGVFNLIPGFPLDGGRVLRSVIWALTGSLVTATRWASWAGQGIAWLMIMAGIASVFGFRLPLIGGGVANGLWLAFIGWFLSNAAVQSYRQVVIQDLLEDIPVSDIMRRDPPTVTPGISVTSLVHDYVIGTDDVAFPVVDDGGIVGIVTLQDVRRVDRADWQATTARDIMTGADDLVLAESGEDAADALTKLMQREVNQLPVVEQGRLVGLLRRKDIIRWLRLQRSSV